MREKIKQLLGDLLGSGVLLLTVLAVFAVVSFLGGNFMTLFGFSYESVGSLLLYFVAGELISLPLELVIVGMSQSLYRQGHVDRRQANLLYVPLDTMATIFAWSGALRKRGELDGICELVDFADKLENACFDTLNSGYMTKDLTLLAEPGTEVHPVNSGEFLDIIAGRLRESLGA